VHADRCCLAVAMSAAVWLSRPQLTCGVPAPALGISPAAAGA
jgi:hypothetical protein